MSNDTTRRNRVKDRLDRHDPEPKEEVAQRNDGLAESADAAQPKPRTEPRDDDTEPEDEPPAPRKPGPSGPRLPG
jgi:hypothetical protein